MIMATLSIHSNAPVAAQTRDRSEIPVGHTWNLGDIYASDEAWEEAKESMASRFNDVLQYKGMLADSPKQLLSCLEFNSDISKEYGRLYSYASMKSDQDTRDSKYNAMKQEMIQLGTDFSSMSSFIEPEILEIDEERINELIKTEPGLEVYAFYLRDLQRTKTHKLSAKEEKILAEAGLMASGPYSIYRIFTNAELPYPKVTLSDGEEVTIDLAGYSKYRAVKNRADRESVFNTFWSTMDQFRGTFGEQLYANVKKNMFYARTRGYDSALASALDENNIPTDVYHALVKNVNDNIHFFHRYLNIKKRMLDVDTLKYSDLYAPVVKGVDLKYPVEEAQALVLESLEPLPKDYRKVVEKAFENRWIDFYPSTGKRSGAYSNGSIYDVHPYILMNYNGKYDDVTTLAHELGHTMHSYYSNKAQPFPLSDYSIFVAEVASTFNEALLIHKVLEKIDDDNVRLSLLMNYLDGIKGTLFRQTQFAEFELRMHEKAEGGEPLTGDVLTELYGDILKQYYGHDQGVCFIDDLYTVEWAFIPHFYYNFYVYQYSTSFTASIALSEKVLNGDKTAVKKYIDFISAGGSDYPIEILKRAGVDMTTAEPFDKTMEAMERTMDEIEKILNK